MIHPTPSPSSQQKAMFHISMVHSSSNLECWCKWLWNVLQPIFAFTQIALQATLWGVYMLDVDDPQDNIKKPKARICLIWWVTDTVTGVNNPHFYFQNASNNSNAMETGKFDCYLVDWVDYRLCLMSLLYFYPMFNSYRIVTVVIGIGILKSIYRKIILLCFPKKYCSIFYSYSKYSTVQIRTAWQRCTFSNNVKCCIAQIKV